MEACSAFDGTPKFVVGLMESSQAAPGCVTVNTRPPTVMVPVRAPGVVLGETLKDSVALPPPTAAEVNVIQETLDTAVHVHVVPN